MPLAIPLAEVATLVVALLILFAADLLFRGFLQSLAARIPVVGPSIGRLVGAVLDDTTAWVKRQISNSLSAIWGWIMTPVHWIATLVERIITQLYLTATTIAHLAASVIPGLKLELVSLIDQQITRAETYALGLDQGISKDFTAALAGVYAYIQSQISGVDGYVLTELHAVDAYVQTEIANLTAYIGVTDASLLTYVQQALATDQAFARALAADAVTYAQSAVTALGQSVAVDLGGLQDWVTSQISALSTYIQGILAASYAYTDTAIAGVQAEIQTIRDDCLDNLCSNLSPLASLLGDLSGLWDISALIALGIAFATDPGGAAGEVRSALGEVAGDTVSTIRSAMGV